MNRFFGYLGMRIHRWSQKREDVPAEPKDATEYRSALHYISTLSTSELRPTTGWLEFTLNRVRPVPVYEKLREIDPKCSPLDLLWAEYVRRVGVEKAYKRASKDILSGYKPDGGRLDLDITRFGKATLHSELGIEISREDMNDFILRGKPYDTVERHIYYCSEYWCYPTEVIRDVYLAEYKRRFTGLTLEKATQLFEVAIELWTLFILMSNSNNGG